MQKLAKFFLILFLLSFPFQLGKHFWPSWSYIWGLRLDYLAPTIWISDVFLFLSLLFSASSNFKEISPKKKNYWFWLGLALVMTNIFFAVNRTVSFFGWFKWLRIISTIWLIKQEKNWLQKKLPGIITFWLATEAIFVFGQWWKQGSLGGLGWWLGERNFSLITPGIAKIVFQNRLWLRAYGTFSHPNSLAGFLLVALVILDQRKIKHWWEKLALTLGALCLLLTFSRTVILVAAIYLVFKTTKKISWHRQGAKIALIIFLICWLLKAFPNPLAWQERWLLIKSAWKIFLRRPVLGVGWDNFLTVLPRYWSFNKQAKIVLQPVHNIILLILTQIGLTGLLFFLAVINKFVSWNRKTTLLLGVIFLTGLTDHYWLTLPQNMLLLGLVFGLS